MTIVACGTLGKGDVENISFLCIGRDYVADRGIGILTVGSEAGKG